MSDALVPLPPPSPFAVLASTTQILASQVGDLPCPPPGLPPEVAAKMDCAAMAPFKEAVAWAPRQVDPATLPQTVDLRAHGLVGPVKDQLQVGACAGFAMSTVLDNGGRRQGMTQVVSPLHVFATYAPTGDDFSRSIKHHAFTTEPAWPFDPGRACHFAQDYMGASCVSEYGVQPGSAPSAPWLLAERDRADAMGHLRIMGYEEMPRDPAQWMVVLASGEAMWVAFEFEERAWNGMVDNGSTHLPWYPVDPNAIPHAVGLVGYRATPSGREFLIQNSWGQKWGMRGFAWVAESVAVEKFKYGYRVLSVHASVPAPPFEPSAGGMNQALGPWLEQTMPSLFPAGQLPLPGGQLQLPAGFPNFPRPF